MRGRMRTLTASTLALAFLALAVAAPAAGQVATTPGSAYGCTSTTYRPTAAPQYALTTYDCGEATCFWLRQEGTYVSLMDCAPGGFAVEGDRLCHDTGAGAWSAQTHTYAYERRCVGPEARDDGACVERTSDVQDGRPAVVAHECVEVEDSGACRSEHYSWDYGGTFEEEACARLVVRSEPCGRAVLLLLGDVTGWADALGGLYPRETRVACAPF